MRALRFSGLQFCFNLEKNRETRGQKRAYIAVEHLNGFVSFLNSAHGNKAKPTALVSLSVVNNLKLHRTLSSLQPQWKKFH